LAGLVGLALLASCDARPCQAHQWRAPASRHNGGYRRGSLFCDYLLGFEIWHSAARGDHRRRRAPSAASSAPSDHDAEALFFSAVLFTIGVVGVLTRRNAIIIFMCVGLMLNAVNLSFVAFSGCTGGRAGVRGIRDDSRRRRSGGRARHHHFDLPAS
jgi:hypothetical protein